MAGQWWYCLRHHAVEPTDACKAEERLGPYDTYDAAADALKRVQERNTAWEEDPRFNDADEDEDDQERQGWGPFAH